MRAVRALSDDCSACTSSSCQQQRRFCRRSVLRVNSAQHAPEYRHDHIRSRDHPHSLRRLHGVPVYGGSVCQPLASRCFSERTECDRFIREQQLTTTGRVAAQIQQADARLGCTRQLIHLHALQFGTQLADRKTLTRGI